MSTAQQQIKRFSLAQRVEHFVLILSFTLLGLTGLPQKYPLSPISQWAVSFMGGIETVRIIHRVAATVFLLEAIYHLVVVGYKLWVERREASMVPTIKDGTDAIQSFLFNIGVRKTPPEMPRYNFTEKMEYWAMLWGFLVMAVTGFMLWNPILTTNILPGQFIPAAKIAHGGEAVLAVLAIILWHFYHVHIRHFNRSMFTGYMSRDAMKEEHGAELKKIESGHVVSIASAEERSRRMKIFVPVAAIASVAMLVLVYWFVTFEDSAITTLPPAQQGQAFVPQTPTPMPTATQTAVPVPTTEGQQPGGTDTLTWNGGIQEVFASRCGSCHGTMGGYSARSYVDAIEGINPGDPENSVVIQVQEAAHPGKFTEAELEQVVEWITAGAPEQ